MARGWKRIAELLIARSGMAARSERRSRPVTVVLAYHNVVPRGESLAGDASLHIDQKVFADQLDFLLDGRSIVGLQDLVGGAPDDPGRTRVVITFDDAYVGAMTAGLEELTKRGLPCTVFVPPGLLGSEGFWWDRLAPEGGRPLDDAVREHALGPLRGRGDDIVGWAEAQGLTVRDVPSHARPVGPEALAPGRLPAGVSLGAHTWSHPNLAVLSPDEVSDELSRSKAWLSRETDRYVDWLAYPYGLHSDAAVEATSQTFAGAVLVSGGAYETRGSRSASPHRIPRVNVPRGLSLEGLALRLGGLA